MNQKRRADFDVICRKLNDVQEELYRIQRSEEKTYVRIPEALRGGRTGAASQMALRNIEYALESLKKAVNDLEAITLSAFL